MSVFGKTAWLDRKGLTRAGIQIFRMTPALVAETIDNVTQTIESRATTVVNAIEKHQI